LIPIVEIGTIPFEGAVGLAVGGAGTGTWAGTAEATDTVGFSTFFGGRAGAEAATLGTGALGSGRVDGRGSVLGGSMDEAADETALETAGAELGAGNVLVAWSFEATIRG
jgi:hypothetical protein